MYLLICIYMYIQDQDYTVGHNYLSYAISGLKISVKGHKSHSIE